MKRFTTLFTVVAILFASFFLASPANATTHHTPTHAFNKTHHTPTHHVKHSTRCEEDQPCWNCKTMGNKICGPIKAPVDCTPRKGFTWPAQCKAPTQWVDYGPTGLTSSQIQFCQHPYLGGAWAGSSIACKLYR